MNDNEKREYLVTEIKKYNEEQINELEKGWFINFLIVLFLILQNINFEKIPVDIQHISEQVFKDLSFFGLIALVPEGIINFIKTIIYSIKEMKLEFELDKIDKEKIKVKYK